MHEKHGVDVVALVRHPAAFYYSHKRLGWDFDLDNLREQPHLVNDHLEQEAHLLEQTDWAYPERLAILWRCVNKVLKDFSDTFTEEDTWTLKCHEDFCRRPIQEFGCLQAFEFGLFVVSEAIHPRVDKSEEPDIGTEQRDSSASAEFRRSRILLEA